MLGAEHSSCGQKSDYQLFDAVPSNAGRIRKSVRLGGGYRALGECLTLHRLAAGLMRGSMTILQKQR